METPKITIPSVEGVGNDKMSPAYIRLRDEVITIWTKILDDLPKRREWELPKTLTNGEYDSNQTEYERLANNLKLAVVANSTIEGRILHLALRTIIDKHSIAWVAERFYDFYEDADEYEERCAGDEVELDDLVRGLSERESTYSEIFEHGQPISVTLSGCKILKPGEKIPKGKTTPEETITVQKSPFSKGMYRITTKITKHLSDVKVFDYTTIRETLLRYLESA